MLINYSEVFQTFTTSHYFLCIVYTTPKYSTLLNNLHIYHIKLLSQYSVFQIKIHHITQQSTHLSNHTTLSVQCIPHQNTEHYSTIYTITTSHYFLCIVYTTPKYSTLLNNLHIYHITLLSIYRVCHTKMHQITQHLNIYQITLLSMYSVCHTKIHHITQQFTHLPQHSTLCIVYATPKYSTLLKNLHIYHITILFVYSVYHTKIQHITQQSTLHIYHITILFVYSVYHTKIQHITQKSTHLLPPNLAFSFSNLTQPQGQDKDQQQRCYLGLNS